LHGRAQFSTLAEAARAPSTALEVIGMTNVTEAKLRREAEICYARLRDHGLRLLHPEHESVTASQIIAKLSQNAENAQRVLRAAVRTLRRTKLASGARRCSMRW